MSKIANNKLFDNFLNILITNNILEEEEKENVLKHCREEDDDPISILIDEFGLNSKKVTRVLSKIGNISIADIEKVDTEKLEELVKNNEYLEKLEEYKGCVPLLVNSNEVYIGIYNPLDAELKDSVHFYLSKVKKKVKLFLLDYNDFSKLYEKLFDTGMGFDSFDESELDEVEEVEQEEEESVSLSDANDNPIVKFVNGILLDAIKKGASDLHFEPYEKAFRVRFRIDGILQVAKRPPLKLASKITARLKVISGMDLAEKRRPQDGRIKLKVTKTKDIDFRVNTLPTLFGEKVVLRILDPSAAKMGIDMLGYEAEQKELYMTNLYKPQGMILVTGPTGSGKTVSLYTGLNIINTEDTNISTAEDPVEINLEGINQVNINVKQGMTFAEALRSFLRQDPDVIMVGEIRDLETAEIAIKAAQTGHLVLSTLHTNSAPETLTRLMNMGVAPFNIANSVSIIIAQRLARRLCPNCREEDDTPKERLIEDFGFTKEQAETSKIFKPNKKGCEKCSKGYKGRVGIYEVMPITKSISKIILEKGNALQIAEAAQKDNINNLRQSGVLKAIQGLTSLEEVNRVTTD